MSSPGYNPCDVQLIVQICSIGIVCSDIAVVKRSYAINIKCGLVISVASLMFTVIPSWYVSLIATASPLIAGLGSKRIM